VPHADKLEAIDYDAYQKIANRPGAELWAEASDSTYPIQPFHLHRYAQESVRLYRVENGTAREFLFDPSLFIYGKSAALAALPPDLGFAGFRIEGHDDTPDWLAFMGASYFRSSGELNQYGLSARGIAIDTAMPVPEEFPRFTAFWLAEPGDGTVVINALLDGPSLAGAYRITARRDAVVITDVDAVLYPRRRIDRLGIAPLTSMFWYSELSRRTAIDWRPEVHDSDGLAMWTGAGERLWRPLNDPPQVQTSSFFDSNPRGFGLLQRDRDFNNYQDDGVFYDKRPSVWVEPRGDWGKGAVQLVEIPTDDEIHDNIVAYWLPSEPAQPGREYSYSYRLTWAADEPHPPINGRVVASRAGVGGVPGQPRPPGRMKFVVDFAGGPLEALKKLDPVKPVATASRGDIVNPYALQVVGSTTWRAFFDLDVSGAEPVELRLFLEKDGEALTETWLSQYIPPAAGLAGKTG
jgi:glucans biosynthesis protein